MSQTDRPNTLSETIHLAQVDVMEIAQLRADAQALLDLSAGCESLHVMAHRIFINTDPLMPTNPDAHTEASDRLRALRGRLSDTLEYLDALYVSGCAEEDRQDNAFFDFDDRPNRGDGGHG
ncbi:MAG: hypothetical protein WAW36_19010 [Methylovulum miyakonense]|uniref:hypothetical protein n=1 Tax=Methylovulum miyakonense TaxID=645578 RepID=UPI003BB678DD